MGKFEWFYEYFKRKSLAESMSHDILKCCLPETNSLQSLSLKQALQSTSKHNNDLLFIYQWNFWLWHEFNR